MGLRAWAVAWAAALSLIAGQAQACMHWGYRPLHADARIRAKDGAWRRAWIEADDNRLRLEMEHPRTPWGRLVMVADIQQGDAEVFGIGKPPRPARVVWRTTAVKALAEFGLPETFLSLGYDAQTNPEAPRAIYGTWDCRHPSDWQSGGDGRYDTSMCFHASGIPLYMSRNGQRIFEVDRLVFAPVPANRFGRPPGYGLTDDKPGYLNGYTC